MLPDKNTCYKALLAHDPRFDGKFFVAVRSTGIYCRTVCRARTPRFENCAFFQNAAAAEKAGYRPCLRCRPELAPGSSRSDSLSRSAAVIARSIQEGQLSANFLSELCRRLSISPRQLRRVVESSFGVSPLELAITQKLLLSRQLLQNSRLSITEIALASGFGSIRRFNAAFKQHYGMSPSMLKQRTERKSEAEFNCAISYRKPFDWKSLLSFLEKRATQGLEHIIDGSYSRVVQIADRSGYFTAVNNAGEGRIELAVSHSLMPVLMPLLLRVRRLFDLDCDPELIECDLKELAAANPGLRIAGAFDGFETAVRGIMGQQVSVKAAGTIMNRFCCTYGSKISTPYEKLFLSFPSIETVAAIDPDELCRIGLVKQRAESIVQLARFCLDGKLSLEQAVDPLDSMEKLKQVKGIGDWTANYIAMRCWSWPDAFPYSDAGIQKALASKNKKLILEKAECWRPWRSYAAFHLWKNLDS